MINCQFELFYRPRLAPQTGLELFEAKNSGGL